MRVEYVTTTWMEFCIPQNTPSDTLDALRAMDALKPYGKTHLVIFEPGEVVFTDSRWRQWKPVQDDRGLLDCAEAAIKRARRLRQREPVICGMREWPHLPDEAGNRKVRFLDQGSLALHHQQTATVAP